MLFRGTLGGQRCVIGVHYDGIIYEGALAGYSSMDIELEVHFNEKHKTQEDLREAVVKWITNVLNFEEP